MNDRHDMSDTMRDAPEPLKIEPGTDMHLTLLMAPDSLNLVVGEDRAALLRYAKRVWQAAQSQPSPLVPATVQEILHLLSPYVRACMNSVVMSPQSVEQCEAAFKPIEAALIALVEKNHELQFSLDGVNAMRRPLNDYFQLVPKKPTPEMLHALTQKAAQGYVLEGYRAMLAAAPPTHGIEPEQGGNHG